MLFARRTAAYALIGVLSSVLATARAAGFIEGVPPLILGKLSSSEEVRGVFTETKVTPDKKEYVTKGVFHIRPGTDFEWKTTDPFETRFYATPEKYVYSNEDETVSRPLAELPRFSRLETLMKKDFSVFFKLFNALYAEENGIFHIKAKPKAGELAKFLECVEADGTTTDWTLGVHLVNGTLFRIRFQENAK